MSRRESSASELHVLTLTPFYPSQRDERGGFVSEAIGEMECHGLRSSVLAVRPVYKRGVRPSGVAPEATWVRYLAAPGNAGLASAGRLLFWRLRRLVRRMHEADPIAVLHAHAALPCGEAARLLGQELGIPVVVTVHGLDAYFTEQISGAAGVRCAAMSRQVYEQAARVVCISEQVRRRVLEGALGLSTTEIVYNGVDAGAFSPGGRVPGTEFVVASVGSLIPIKGHDVTLGALAALQAEFPGVRCRIVGEGPELGRLQDLARRLGISERVEFLGRQRRGQVARLLQASDVFVLPSRYEGLGVAYLEAMATGLPAVAYRGQGIEEVIRHGENGILLANHGPETAARDLAAVLRTLIQQDGMRAKLGVAARRTVVGGFTLLHQARGLLRVFESAAESARRERPA